VHKIYGLSTFRQIRELQLAVSQPLGLLLFEVVACFTSLGIALYFTWKLTLVMLATFPFVGAILFLATRGLAPAVEAQKRDLNKASKCANTAVTAIDTVKAFNGQDHEIWQYTCAMKRVTTNYLLQAHSNALQFGIIRFIIVGLFVQGFWFGVYLVNNGLDPGHILTAFYACLSAMQAAEVVLPQWLVLAKGMSAGEALKCIIRQMQHDPGGSTVAYLTRPKSCSGDVEIKNVNICISCYETLILLTKSLGLLRISIQCRAVRPEQCQPIFPQWRNDIHCWPQRIGQKYSWKSDHEILQAAIWRNSDR
jgi:ATP-binding cassette subfamily B (MDR/TAP) protein 1